jgi:hypothetical protein
MPDREAYALDQLDDVQTVTLGLPGPARPGVRRWQMRLIAKGPVERTDRAAMLSGRAVKNQRVPFLAVTVTAAGNHVWVAFTCVCRVMPVLHQMKSESEARYTYPLFISGPGAARR